jgi:hypothetical protein
VGPGSRVRLGVVGKPDGVAGLRSGHNGRGCALQGLHLDDRPALGDLPAAVCPFGDASWPSGRQVAGELARHGCSAQCLGDRAPPGWDDPVRVRLGAGRPGRGGSSPTPAPQLRHSPGEALSRPGRQTGRHRDLLRRDVPWFRAGLRHRGGHRRGAGQRPVGTRSCLRCGRGCRARGGPCPDALPLRQRALQLFGRFGRTAPAVGRPCQHGLSRC